MVLVTLKKVLNITILSILTLCSFKSVILDYFKIWKMQEGVEEAL